ncbi:MAG: sulfatase-like hydrolase/transferase [Verrucomicrobiota bacterium]
MSVASFATSSQPNIVVILADDLGYETIGAYGGQSYATPRLDALAASGIRFRHAHAQPLCTPTRVQMMTGKYNVRNYDVFGILAPGQMTFGNLFRDAGYKTFVAGKWQLEGGYDAPINFGFDEYFLWQLTRRPQRYNAPGFEALIPADGLNKTQVDYPAGSYGPDLVTGKILNFIERNQASPFLVYYPMLLTHAPFTPSPDHTNYNPTLTDELDDPVYFGSMVEYMDKTIGRIVDKLDQLGLRENTLIVFIGDNGTDTSVTSTQNGNPVTGGKGKTTDAGTRVPLIVNWPNTIPINQVSEALVDSSDIFPTVCQAAGVAIPSGLDGRSFFPQLLGQTGTPRDWSYCWYKPQNGTEADVKEFAHTTRFKLYATGKFYDVANDVLEQSEINTNSLNAEAQAAFTLLKNTLNSFNDARVERTLPPTPNPAVWSSLPSPKGVAKIGMTAANGVDANGPVQYQFRNVTLSRDSAWQLSPGYTDSGLDDATTYSYQVRMQDLVGNATGWSAAQSTTTPTSPNPRIVIIDQAETDGNSGGQNLGQSFTSTAPQEGWFLETITFYAVTNSGGGDSAYLTLYDGFTNRTSRGKILSVSANAALNPRTAGVPMTWLFTNVMLKAGVTYFAAASDASGAPLSANQGIPAQRMHVNVYAGGSRLNETGITTDFDLKFSVSARQFPANYAQWSLAIPTNSPNGFGEATSPGAMVNGYKYFFGLAPMENDPSRWPRIKAGYYDFILNRNASDVFWRIRHTPNLQTPAASWQSVDASTLSLLYDPATGHVQFPLPNSDAGFFRLEIGLE